MARPQLILPRADATCGKTFFADRRTADGHRIALEVWDRATGRAREGYRLAVYRCKRCAGFHIGRKPIDQVPVPPRPLPGGDHDLDERGRIDDGGYEAPRAHRVACFEPSWS